MGTELQWEGHEILIESRPAAKYFWLATETVIIVDGVEVARSGGFSFTEKTIGKTIENNRSYELCLEVKVDLVTFISVPYKLLIDGDIIAQGRLGINNWPLFLVPMSILPFLICCPITLILYILSINYPVK